MVIHNVYEVINMSYIILPYMMNDHMFGCYHCHAEMDDLQDLVAHCKSQHSDVSGNFSFRNFAMTKNIYQ